MGSLKTVTSVDCNWLITIHSFFIIIIYFRGDYD